MSVAELAAVMLVGAGIGVAFSAVYAVPFSWAPFPRRTWTLARVLVPICAGFLGAVYVASEWLAL